MSATAPPMSEPPVALDLALPGHVLRIVFACFLLLVAVRLMRDGLALQ